jgi:hypothetical protein
MLLYLCTQTKDVLEACIQQSEKAEAAKTVGDQTADDIDWHAVLSKVQLSERQANALAEVHHHLHLHLAWEPCPSCFSSLTEHGGWAILEAVRTHVRTAHAAHAGTQDSRA